MKDAFKKYLEEENNENNKNKALALRDCSYKNIDHSLTDQNVNNELATYGDALLKLALCQLLFEEKVENITEEKKKYESDKILVSVVAKEYDLLQYISFDKKDEKIPQNYEYEKNGNKSTHKYIATAAETLLAAFYLDNNKNFDLTLGIVKNWKDLIDKAVEQSEH